MDEVGQVIGFVAIKVLDHLLVIEKGITKIIERFGWDHWISCLGLGVSEAK
jgi:hypothetical protein